MMKTTATLFTCFTVSLILVSGNATAGNNRFSGKSSKSSSSRSFSHQGNHHSRTKNFNNRSGHSQYNHRSSNQRFSRYNKSSSRQNNYKTSFNTKTNNHHFKSTPKQFNPQHKATQRPFKTEHKTINHNKFHGHYNNHHGHHHRNRPWVHINTRPLCPPVCRPWYPVTCVDPIITPCVITACAPVYSNKTGEAVVEVSEETVTAEFTETETSTEPVKQERLELVSGKRFQLSAEGLGDEQGMVILEINEMGLPANIETWEDGVLAFQTPQIGLSKVTEAKMHVMNSKGQLLATLDINLLPATEQVTNTVASN
ncbi:hypothetical protein [Gimesia maris]|uniref:hypothetical protein n=1 Tax=Gimesia maris TaxID=122 RepID=UPI0030D7369C|tara:strand:- start:77380 stop:78315 length:936 start_codon:yes stop_codon:yes gene_type:complete